MARSIYSEKLKHRTNRVKLPAKKKPYKQRALKLARGSEGDSDKPVTVDEALIAYESGLAARGGAKYNATSLRKHVPSALLSKVVMLLTVRIASVAQIPD